MECGVTEDSVGALVAKAQECRAVQELSLGSDRLGLPERSVATPESQVAIW